MTPGTPCHRKLSYRSRKLAAMVAARQRALSGEYIHAYHCAKCHAFHTGHPNPWDRGAPSEPMKELA